MQDLEREGDEPADVLPTAEWGDAPARGGRLRFGASGGGQARVRAWPACWCMHNSFCVIAMDAMQLSGDLSKSLSAPYMPAWWSKASACAQHQSFWRWPDTIPFSCVLQAMAAGAEKHP